MNDDNQLARRMQQGDPEAMERFVDRYGARVHRLVRRYIACETDAEDVTQEIFLDLWRGIGGFRGAASLSTWVYRVAVNHCLKHQGRMRPATVPYDEAFDAVPDDSARADPARHTARRELKEQVQDALAALPAGHRDVVLLHEMHGLTYGECAAALGIPVGTVKSRLSNAFRRLRVCLGGYVLGGDDNPPRTVEEIAG